MTNQTVLFFKIKMKLFSKNFAQNNANNFYKVFEINNYPLKMREPLGKCRTSSNGFCVKGPVIWNSVPHELQVVRERHIFKYRIKNHLFQSYSVTTDCTNPRCTDRRHHH